MGLVQIRKVFGGRDRDGERIRQQTCVEKHLTAANCLHISGGLRPETPSGLRPWNTLGTSVPQAPVPTLTSKPGYTTAASASPAEANIKIKHLRNG